MNGLAVQAYLVSGQVNYQTAMLETLNAWAGAPQKSYSSNSSQGWSA